MAAEIFGVRKDVAVVHHSKILFANL